MADYRSITDYRRADRTVEQTIVDSDGHVRIETIQDCEPILDAIAAARDLPQTKTMRHVGSIPLVVYTQWMREAGIAPSHPDTHKKMMEVVRRKLMDGEFAKLRVRGY